MKTVRKDEEESGNSGENLGVLFKASAEGILIVEIKTRKFKYANPAICRMLGYTVEELTGMGVEDIHPKDALNNVLSEIKAQARGEKSLAENISCLKNDGTTFLAEVHESQTLIDGIEYGIGFFTDITERKKVEDDLKESEVRFRELFESMRSGVAVYEAENNGENFIFKNLNAAGEKIEKIDKKDIIGKRVTEVFPEVKEFGVFKVFQRVWRTGKPEYFPDAIYKDARDSGTWRENWVYKLPAGEIVVIYNDITKRKQVEENLKEAITLINRSPAVTFTWRNETGWPVEFVSENVTKLFGYTSEEWTSGKVSYMDIIYPDDLERVAGEVARYSKENGREEFAHEPYRIIAKDGSVHWVHDWTFITRDEKGSITHYKGILQDITERKLAASAMRESEARLSEAQAVVHIGSWSRSLPTNIFIWSKEMCRIYGLSPGAVPTYEIFLKTIHPEDREFVNKSIEDAIKRKKPLDIEFRILPNGKERIVHSIGKTDYDNEGQPIRIFGTCQDITERKQAEEELKKHREHLEELVEDRTKELTEKVTELERFHDATVAREIRMHEQRVEMEILKTQISTDKNTD